MHIGNAYWSLKIYEALGDIYDDGTNHTGVTELWSSADHCTYMTTWSAFLVIVIKVLYHALAHPVSCQLVKNCHV
jgi:hypothetical protein